MTRAASPRRGSFVLLVASGSTVGSLARAGASQLVPDPWTALWLVDVGGALLLGFLTGALAGRPSGRWLTPLLGPGVLGGFTTLSAVTVLVAGSGSGWPLAFASLVALTLTGVMAGWAGLRWGRGLGASGARQPGLPAAPEAAPEDPAPEDHAPDGPERSA
ncbi:fluoride efflux transporter FluC [Auraticoccus monumenti]|uniref:Fluoride-specific ion channel n=1 Tax=Auraticoccus monumenti TaxID=675864 RepID=A0A1G6RU70_9ACTN|nr:CrcB family protein [Auraticoccus monumenti]SDD07983.1 Fluoride ion exporter CrcB/FEX, affects chromosome condensation [Auraticoccus monumenti]